MSISFTAHLQAESGRKEGTGGTTGAAERAHLQEGRAALRLEAQLGTREITTPRDTRRGGLAAVDARYRGATAAENLGTDIEHRPGVSKLANFCMEVRFPVICAKQAGGTCGGGQGASRAT